MAEKRWFEDWEREQEETKTERERQENERRKLDEATAVKKSPEALDEPALKKVEEPYKLHEGKHGQFSFFEIPDKKEAKKFPTSNFIPVVREDPQDMLENE